MTRRSHRNRQRSSNSDPLDDLVNESRHTALQRNPLIRSGSGVLNRGVEDLRRWAPRVHREPPREVSGRIARVSHQPKTSPRVIRGPGGKPLSRRGVAKPVWSAAPRFAEARKTYICFKRKVRQQVLFALKRTKAGRGVPKKRNQWSEVQC